MLTSKKKKILKREKIKNGLGSQREKILFPLLFLDVCDTKKKKKTNLLQWALVSIALEK